MASFQHGRYFRSFALGRSTASNQFTTGIAGTYMKRRERRYLGADDQLGFRGFGLSSLR